MVLRRLALVFSLLAVALCVALARPADSATIITVSATGTISDSSEAGLIGREASMSQRFVVTAGSLFPGADFGAGVFDKLSVSIVADGTPFLFDTSGGAPAFGLYALARLDIPATTPASISAESTIEVAPGVTLFARALLSTLAADSVDPSNLLGDFTFPPFPAGAASSFGAEATDAGGDLLGYFLVEAVREFTVVVDRDVVVPAPAGLAILLAGVGGLALAGRRRRA
jgi:hypothetical protein